jgi:hypothetical protein
MLLRPEYLSRELKRPLPTKDGGILRTIRDACDYMTGMDKKRELRSHWQRACKFILHKRAAWILPWPPVSAGVVPEIRVRARPASPRRPYLLSYAYGRFSGTQRIQRNILS